LNPWGDIAIEITGLRHGEKLHEELLIGSMCETTRHSRINRAKERFLTWKILKLELEKLEIALKKNDVPTAIREIERLVEGYKKPENIVDTTYKKFKMSTDVSGQHYFF
jgi:FlaA1/EpsC-like NDP-sugar epimerase